MHNYLNGLEIQRVYPLIYPIYVEAFFLFYEKRKNDSGNLNDYHSSAGIDEPDTSTFSA